MNEFSTSISWIAAGTLLFILAIYALIHGMKKLGDEGLEPEAPYNHRQVAEAPPVDEDPEIIKLEKYEQMYNHFKYTEIGLTFNDYVRKIECGTWGELAD